MNASTLDLSLLPVISLPMGFITLALAARTVAKKAIEQGLACAKYVPYVEE